VLRSGVLLLHRDCAFASIAIHHDRCLRVLACEHRARRATALLLNPTQVNLVSDQFDAPDETPVN
jgi:hypothetical protein